MTLTVATIIAWLDTGLTLAVNAGLVPAQVDAVVNAIITAYNGMAANLAQADRSTLDQEAIAVFRAKSLAVVDRNGQLQREFAATESDDPPPTPV